MPIREVIILVSRRGRRPKVKQTFIYDSMKNAQDEVVISLTWSDARERGQPALAIPDMAQYTLDVSVFDCSLTEISASLHIHYRSEDWKQYFSR